MMQPEDPLPRARPSAATADPMATYPLLRLEMDVPEALAEAAVGAAWRLGAQGVAIRDGSTGDAPPGRAVICSWMPADDADGLLRDAERCLGELRASARLRLVPEDPRAWRAHLGGPIVVGGFTIVPDVSDPAGVVAVPAAGTPAAEMSAAETCAAPPGRAGATRGMHRLLIEPGSAFGGGTHPTTALCLRAIEARFAAADPPCAVLDVGTGTGILALAAATLGGRVEATDIDPLARQAARRHAARNRLADRITIGAALPDGPFDLIVANLYLGPLCALAPALARRLAPDGRCVVSGITEAHRPAVEAAFDAQGLGPVGALEADGWVALTLSRSRLDGHAPTADADRCNPDGGPPGRSHPDPEAP